VLKRGQNRSEAKRIEFKKLSLLFEMEEIDHHKTQVMLAGKKRKIRSMQGGQN